MINYLSFLSRHSCCLCTMGFALISIIFFSLTFSTFPSSSLGTLRTWLCGTCTICQLCPSCEPHLNVSPQCECHENLNNCNCNCITHKSLHTYHQQWNSQLLAAQHNTHAAQLNGTQYKRWLLFWLIGLSCFNILMLIFIILLIIYTPVLLRRCADSKSQSKLHRRQHLMRKHNLVEPPPLSTIESTPQQLLPIVSNFIETLNAPLNSSYNTLSHPLTVQPPVAIRLQNDLPTAPTMRPTIGPK